MSLGGFPVVQSRSIGMLLTERVMLSSGGVFLTDLLEPTHTVMAAVEMMFKLAGTLISIGATATMTSSKCDTGHGSCSTEGVETASVMWIVARQIRLSAVQRHLRLGRAASCLVWEQGARLTSMCHKPTKCMRSNRSWTVRLEVDCWRMRSSWSCK